jgi:hypothetical protein
LTLFPRFRGEEKTIPVHLGVRNRTTERLARRLDAYIACPSTSSSMRTLNHNFPPGVAAEEDHHCPRLICHPARG